MAYIPSVSLGLYPNNGGELVSWWVRPSAEGMIMSSATVQTTSCMGELVLLQLQNTGFVAQATFTCLKAIHQICRMEIDQSQGCIFV